MPQSLRSILGNSNRVKKPSRPTPPSLSHNYSPLSSQSSQNKAQSPRKGRKTKTKPRHAQKNGNDDDDDDGGGDDDDAYFQDKLTDAGIVKLLHDEELILRDVVQAMRYIRLRMFSPVPATGLYSTRTSEVLNYRIAVPPIVTPGHLNAILHSPTKVEREVVELLRKGVIHKVRVERRGGMGEALIESTDFEDMIRKTNLPEETISKYIIFLKENPTAQTVPRGSGGPLTHGETDELVRAGLLTSSLQAMPGSTLHVRPEDRTTLTSIQHVSRFASGTVSAVGGRNAIHLAGGSGGAPTLTHAASSSSSSLPLSLSSSASDFRIAVPGHGRYLKLAEGSVDWLRDMLGRTKWGEAPEKWFKDRFEGGGLYGTRWKEFWGVEWEWVLGQAVGLGVVEIFDTGSVGRGVRALGI